MPNYFYREAKPAKDFPKEWLVVPALDASREIDYFKDKFKKELKQVLETGSWKSFLELTKKYNVK